MRIQLGKRLAALERQFSPNDLSRLSNEQLENSLCDAFEEMPRDFSIDLVRECLEPELERRFIRAFYRWHALRAGELDHDDETLLPVTELDRQFH